MGQLITSTQAAKLFALFDCTDPLLLSWEDEHIGTLNFDVSSLWTVTNCLPRQGRQTINPCSVYLHTRRVSQKVSLQWQGKAAERKLSIGDMNDNHGAATMQNQINSFQYELWIHHNRLLK